MYIVISILYFVLASATSFHCDNNVYSGDLFSSSPFLLSEGQVSGFHGNCGSYESECIRDASGRFVKTLVVFNGTESGNPYSTTMTTTTYVDSECQAISEVTLMERFVITTLRDHRKYHLEPMESTVVFHSQDLLDAVCSGYQLSKGREFYTSEVPCLHKYRSSSKNVLTTFQQYYLDIFDLESNVWTEYYPVSTSGCIKDDETFCGTYRRCQFDQDHSFLLTTKITGDFGHYPVDIRFDKDEHFGGYCNDSQIMRGYAFNVTPTNGQNNFRYQLHHIYLKLSGTWWQSFWNCTNFETGKVYDVMDVNCTTIATGEPAFDSLRERIGQKGNIYLEYKNNTLTHNWDGTKAIMDLMNYDGCTFSCVCFLNFAICCEYR